MLTCLHPEIRRWLLLLSLLLVSGLTLYAISYAFSPQQISWLIPSLGFVLTAVLFIFSFSDRNLRHTALAALGIAALLSGPFLAFIFFNELAGNPPGHRKIPTLFYLAPLLLGLFLSALLFGWESIRFVSRRSFLTPPQPLTRRFLFYSLIYLLLIVPSCSTRSAALTVRHLTELPAHRQDLPADKDAFSQVMQSNFILTLYKTLGDLSKESVAPLTYLFTLSLLFHAFRARLRSPRETLPEIFPQAKDILLLVTWLISGLLFYYFAQAVDFKASDMSRSAKNYPELTPYVHQLQTYYQILIFLPTITFVLNSLFLAYRFHQAQRIHVLFGSWFLIVSVGLSVSVLGQAPGNFQWAGATAVFACLLQGILFFGKRTSWVFQPWGQTGETALQMALQGSLALGLLGASFWSYAAGAAIISVIDLEYLTTYGQAITKGLPAPAETLSPLFTSLLNPLLVGPIFFTACLFLSSSLSLILSVIYALTQALASYLKLIWTSSRP